MRLILAAKYRLRALLTRSTLDEELDAELRDHIERAIRANRARGLPEQEARRLALAAFGGVQRYKEETRDAHGLRWFDDAVQDLRYAARSLRRTPGFTIVAMLTLALGIGATTAMFTVVDGVLLRPLPFHDPGRLYVASNLPRDLPLPIPPGLLDRLYETYRRRTRAFEQVAGYQRASFALSGAGDATQLAGARVAASFFPLLGVPLALGRSFSSDEEQPGRDRVAIISDKLWRERFGSDRRILGRLIQLGAVPYTVVGVAPRGFDFPNSASVWTPLAIQLNPQNSIICPVLGRLAPGATVEQAVAELQTIAAAMPSDRRAHAEPTQARIIPLKAQLTGNVQQSLLVFSGAVAFVLLIAGANVANLLLIRGAARRHELAIRRALGAGGLRIARQLLTESVLLASVGASVGVGIAVLGVRALATLAPPGRIPRLNEVHVDGAALAFALVTALGTGLLFGLVPALSGARRQPRDDLSNSSRTISSSQKQLRSTFAVAQIALALVLLAGAGLMIRSFARMRAVDTGFHAAGVVTMSVDLPASAYADAPRAAQFHSRVLERLAAIPGVLSAAAVSFRPMAEVGIMGDFTVENGRALPRGYAVDKPTVSAGYFAAMGIRVLRGRDFSPRDDAHAPGVVIVSESVARTVWPNEDAVGKRISMNDRPGPDDWLTVVGVVDDVVQDRELRRHAAVYLPYLQATSSFFVREMTYVVRAAVAPTSLVPPMRAALAAVDPTVPAQALQTMDASTLEQLAEPLFQTRLLTAFSLAAFLLAAIGTYGVLAYHVTERRREIAIRAALGADSPRVIRMVIVQTLRLAIVGVALGSAGALATTRVLARFLFEVSPRDPATFAATSALLVATALAAAFLPARRASRVDPMTVLRNE